MSPEESLKDLSRCLSEWRNAYEVAALGIASFGPLELDPNSPNFGSITSTPKPGWSGIDLKPLGAGLPSLIDTDVNGAALAEGRWGAARDLRSWCYITLGTGVGIASIVEGRPVTGAGHSEAGHMRVPLPAGSFEGVCPFHANCVEGVISGPAIAAWAGRSADTIADNDPIWEGVASILAQVCHNLALTTLPQRIVIGGGIAQKRPHLLGMTRQQLAKSLAGYAHTGQFGHDFRDFLVPANLADRAGPLGAIALALDCAAKLR